MYTKDRQAAEDIVQQVFVVLWQTKQDLVENENPKFYLYRSVKNRCLNYIRDTRKMVKDELDNFNPPDTSPGIEENLNVKELQNRINALVDELPPACRRVFLMSRREQLSHKEIAELLDISTKTVENQITKALKHIRSKIN